MRFLTNLFIVEDIPMNIIGYSKPPEIIINKSHYTSLQLNLKIKNKV